MEIPERIKTIDDFRFISEKDIKISKNFFARGLNEVRLDAMDLIEDDVIIRGDLGKILIGPGTILDKGVVLHPCLNSSTPPFEYKNLSIGSNCYIGKQTIVASRSIGNSVYIGNNCILSDRTEIGSNIKILENTYIPPDTRVPDNCVFGGKPGKYLGEIPDGFEKVQEEFCNQYFNSLIIKNKKE